jgi:hypothetical protein
MVMRTKRKQNVKASGAWIGKLFGDLGLGNRPIVFRRRSAPNCSADWARQQRASDRTKVGERQKLSPKNQIMTSADAAPRSRGYRSPLNRHLGAHAQEARGCKAGDKHHKEDEAQAKLSDRWIAHECQPQPEAAMHPAGCEQGELPTLVAGAHQCLNDRGVSRIPEIHREGKTRGHHMTNQQKGQAEARPEPHVFDERQTPMSPEVDRAQCENDVSSSRTVQQQRPGKAVPDVFGDRQHALGEVQTDKPECVVEQMRGDIDEEHKSRSKPKPAGRNAGCFRGVMI